MIRRLLKYALLCVVPTLTQAQTTEIFATQVELQDVWTSETSAQGAPATPACLDTANTYARNPAGSDTHFLKAVAFQPFAIPAGKMITAVSVDVLCRYDNNGHSGAVDVRVLRNGVELATVTSSFFNNSNITDCRWLVGSAGGVTALADWVHNPSWINEIDVWVRRSTSAPQNQTMLKVKGFKIIVTMTDDFDSDLIPDSIDNCDYMSNPNQADADGDGQGDVCDNCTDTDGDFWGNPGFQNTDTCPTDNCPTTYNPNQSDIDGDGAGDVCDSCTDTDHDGFRDPGVTGQACPPDNCPWVSNPNQADQDGDGLGDVCDPCPTTVSCDCNGNGVLDSVDRAQHPDWDRNNDGALDQCFLPVAVADFMQANYPEVSQSIVATNDWAVNSPLRPDDVIYDMDGPPRTYPTTPNKIIIVSGPQHGSLDHETFNPVNSHVKVEVEHHPSPGYACGPDVFYYQVVDALGVPSAPIAVNVTVTLHSQGDCNANLVSDITDCNSGTSRDCNNDDIPDECQCQLDADHDGFLDVCDGCPNDYYKTAPGACGCGISDVDTDNDGTANCVDGCPHDPNKSQPGACGCGVADSDSDGDGLVNCLDGCPNDPAKSLPGLCGCGQSDADSDLDGAPDCLDACPADPSKLSPGTCGCGIADSDGDFDGTLDCLDNCPSTSNASQADCDGDGIGNACDPPGPGEDCNLNGIPDSCDLNEDGNPDSNNDGILDECALPVLTFCLGAHNPGACPCGNNTPEPQASGCANSTGTGARLTVSGNAVLSNDTLILSAAGMPSGGAGLYFQGTGPVAGGVGTPFGDGLVCIGGFIIRISIQISPNGSSQTPVTGEPALSTSGQVVTPGDRYYQLWYRDSPNFCTSSVFNLTNAIRVSWVQ